jgi:hypothetical protein
MKNENYMARSLWVLAAGDLEIPKPAEESVLPAIPNPENIGDVGLRS